MSEKIIGWQYIDVEDYDKHQMVLSEDGMMYVPKVIGHHQERVYIDERGITHFGDYDPEKDEELMRLRKETADYKARVREQTKDMMEESRWGRGNPEKLNLRAHIMALVNSGKPLDHVVKDKTLQNEIIAAVKVWNASRKDFVDYKPLITLDKLIDEIPSRSGVDKAQDTKIEATDNSKQEQQKAIDKGLNPSLVERYLKSYEIKNEKTGGVWNETLDATGEPVFEGDKLIGGRIKMTLTHSGAGGASEQAYDYENVPLEKWKGFVDKAIEIENRKQREEEARKIRDEERKRNEAEREQKPVNYFLSRYLSEKVNE